MGLKDWFASVGVGVGGGDGGDDGVKLSKSCPSA